MTLFKHFANKLVKGQLLNGRVFCSKLVEETDEGLLIFETKTGQKRVNRAADIEYLVEYIPAEDVI